MSDQIQLHGTIIIIKGPKLQCKYYIIRQWTASVNKRQTSMCTGKKVRV